MKAKTLKLPKLPRLNAVLFKDMQQKTKRSKLALSVFLLNLLLTVVATIVLIVLASEAAAFLPINYTTFKTMFIALSYTEFGVISLIAPAITSGSITMEREKQTFDVLLSTRLTPAQIISGKFFASIFQILLLIISGIPVFSLVFIYGGVNLFQAFGVILVLMLLAMTMASLGIYASAVNKKTISSTVTTYMLLLLFFFGTMFIFGLGKVVSLAITDNSYRPDPSAGDAFVFVLLLNPLTTIYDSISRLFGVGFLDITAPGIGGILSDLTDYSANFFVFRHWTLISLIIQVAAAFGFLTLSARAIDPLRQRPDKKNRKRKHVIVTQTPLEANDTASDNTKTGI